MVRQVQLFNAPDMNFLEKMINKFLKSIDTYNFLDVKYNHLLLSYDGQFDLPNILYTAMVVYDDISVPESEGLAGELIGGPAFVETGKGEGV